MIGYASAEDTRLLGGSGGILPRKKLKFEIFKLLKMHWICQFYHQRATLYRLNALQSHQADLYSSWGSACAPAHPLSTSLGH